LTTTQTTTAAPAGAPPWAARAGTLTGSVIDSSTSLLAAQTHDIVRFAMGSPAPEAVPTDVLAPLAAEVFASGAGALDYAATEGDPALRSALLAFLDGTPEATTPERLLITSGGMQGLDLACKLFVDAGDLVAVESPTYTNGTSTVLSYGGEVLEVPVDADGMVVERLPELAEAAGRTPKAIYVIPNFQNPSGTTLSLARRRLLLELAERWDAVIIDDDPYGLLRFAGDPVPSLRALAGDDPRMFSVRTFSKIISPGLRVGWVDTDPRTVQKLIAAKQAMDTCTNLPAQRLVGAFLAGGHLAPHLERLRPEYLRRKQAMRAALDTHLGGRATWTDPEGGFFLWVTLDPAVDTQKLFEVALAEGVAFIPGPPFSASGRFGDALRLCFASTTPDRIEEGVRRLAAALDRVSEGDARA
jgi:2-aminoadipate transaminase